MGFEKIKKKKNSKKEKNLNLEDEENADQVKTSKKKKGDQKSKKKDKKKNKAEQSALMEVDEEKDVNMSFWENEIKSIKDQIGLTPNGDIIRRIDNLSERLESHESEYNLPPFIVSHRLHLCQAFKDILMGKNIYNTSNKKSNHKMQQFEIGDEKSANKITSREQQEIMKDIINEQDKNLEQIFDNVVGLEKTSKDINAEANRHTDIINDLGEETDRASHALIGANKETEALQADSNNCYLYLTIAGLLVLLILVFFMDYGSGL